MDKIAKDILKMSKDVLAEEDEKTFKIDTSGGTPWNRENSFPQGGADEWGDSLESPESTDETTESTSDTTESPESTDVDRDTLEELKDAISDIALNEAKQIREKVLRGLQRNQYLVRELAMKGIYLKR
jgi:hypothetical protein